MKSKVFFDKDGCLRTTLQVFLASFTFLLISMMGQGLVGRMIYNLIQAGVLPGAIYDNYFLTGLLPETILNFFAGTLLLVLYSKINKKKIDFLGRVSLSENLKWIFLGMGTFLVTLFLITGILFAVGDIKFVGIQFHVSILQYILLMSSVSFVEEVLNRGYIQHLVKTRTSSLWWSWLIPSFVFMLFHVQNTGITLLGLINIFLMGFFFSVATQVVGSIWFAFGAHIVWNVGSACIFGLMSVSETTGSILNFVYCKKTVFNGMGETPLYGIITGAVCFLLICLFLLVEKRRSKEREGGAFI